MKKNLTLMLMLFSMLAKTFITNSGRDVPRATTVRPITNCDIPDFLPIEAAPSTRNLAPNNRAAKPAIKRMYIVMNRN